MIKTEKYEREEMCNEGPARRVEGKRGLMNSTGGEDAWGGGGGAGGRRERLHETGTSEGNGKGLRARDR